MITTRTPREIEIRKEIADLDPRIICGVPEHLQARRSDLYRELTSIIASRLTGF